MKCKISGCRQINYPFCERHLSYLAKPFATAIKRAAAESSNILDSFIEDATEIINEKMQSNMSFYIGFKNCKTANDKRKYWRENIKVYNYPYANRRPGPRGLDFYKGKNSKKKLPATERMLEAKYLKDCGFSNAEVAQKLRVSKQGAHFLIKQANERQSIQGDKY